VHVTLSHDMESDAKNPAWTDGLVQYQGEGYAQGACVVVELHTVRAAGGG
jgi:hypothetical protein